MTPIQIDAELAKRLHDAGKKAPLVGPDGKPEGFFVAADEWAFMQAVASEWKRHLDALPRTEWMPTRDGKSHTMAEVLRLVEGS